MFDYIYFIFPLQFATATCLPINKFIDVVTFHIFIFLSCRPDSHRNYGGDINVNNKWRRNAIRVCAVRSEWNIHYGDSAGVTRPTQLLWYDAAQFRFDQVRFSDFAMTSSGVKLSNGFSFASTQYRSASLSAKFKISPFSVCAYLRVRSQVSPFQICTIRLAQSVLGFIQWFPIYASEIENICKWDFFSPLTQIMTR